MSHLYTRSLVANELAKVLIDIISSLSESFETAEPQAFTIRTGFSVSAFDQSITYQTKQQKDWRSEIRAKLQPLDEFEYIDVSSWSIQFTAKPNTTFNIAYSVSKTGSGAISLTNEAGQTLDSNIAKTIVRGLAKSLPLSSRQAVVNSSLSDVQRTQLEYQQQILAELQFASTKLTKDASDFLTESELRLQKRNDELESLFQRRQVELQESFQKKQENLDAELGIKEQGLLSEISSREEALAAREAALVQRAQELDLRDATAARRAGQKQIQLVVEQQKEVNISVGTQKKRYFVHGLCAAGTIIFGTLASFFLYQIISYPSDSFRWQLAFPLSAGVIGFASTLAYWIKWSDDWFREHARAEFANRKLYSDTNRAAWLVEVLLEWSREGKEAIPAAVVESLTKNLFTDVQLESPAHATDSLQKFVTKLANIRVSNEEVELGTGKQSTKART